MSLIIRTTTTTPLPPFLPRPLMCRWVGRFPSHPTPSHPSSSSSSFPIFALKPGFCGLAWSEADAASVMSVLSWPWPWPSSEKSDGPYGGVQFVCRAMDVTVANDIVAPAELMPHASGSARVSPHRRQLAESPQVPVVIPSSCSVSNAEPRRMVSRLQLRNVASLLVPLTRAVACGGLKDPDPSGLSRSGQDSFEVLRASMRKF